MSLRSKIVLILLAVVILYAFLDNGLQRLTVGRSFRSLQLEQAQEDLSRARECIAEELRDLERTGRALAAWGEDWLDPVRARPDAPIPGFRSLAEAEVDLVYVCDSAGRVLFDRVEEPETRRLASLRSLPAQALSANHPLIAASLASDVASGLMKTELGPLHVSALALHGASDAAERIGTLVLGRFLTKERVKELAAAVRIELDLRDPDSDGLTPRERELLDEVTATGEPAFDEVDGRMRGYAALYDLRQLPVLLLRADIDSKIAKSAARVENYSLLTSLATSLVILLVLLRLLQKIIVRPLSTLTKHAIDVGRTEDTSVKLAMERDDEIGHLSAEFDRMLEKLAKSREEVVRTARLAGMSEIATGVLHNVGNVLNSVNVSASLLAGHANELATADLEAVAGVLRQHEGRLAEFVSNDPRGKHLLPFLDGLARSLGTQKQRIQEEIESLGKGIEHIISLVRSQQRYAGKPGVLEPSLLHEQVEAAIDICQKAYGASDGVRIVREYEELPRVLIDRSKTMEIVVNLVMNARQALDLSGQADKRIVVRVRREGPTARIEVEDNGVGIAAEDLTRIFNHGYTTKKDGQGYGLHLSANAATEMKGSLRAESDGPGHGARFVLTLPCPERTLEKAA